MTRARTSLYLSLAAIAVVLTSLLPTATTRAATTITLNPVADAHVAVAAPNSNYGATNPLRVREGGGTSTDPTYRAYLKFDVSSLAGQTIESVTLRLFVPSDPSPNVQNVYRVPDSSWTETTITNANAPQPEADTVGSGAVAVTGYNAIPLGSGVITSSTLQSFFIKSAANNNLAFSSREAATNKPELVVVIADGGPTPTPTDTAPPTPTPTDTAPPTPTPTETVAPTPTQTVAPTPTQTVAPTPTETVAPTPTQTVAPTSTPGGGGSTTINPIADAQVKSDSPTTNYGSATTIRTREDAGTGSDYRSYLKFTIPSGLGTIDSLKLRLFVTDPTTNTNGVYDLGDPTWAENTITFNNAPAISGTPTDFTAPTANAYVEVTLPPNMVTSGETITLGLKSTNTNSLIVNSRNASSNKPELVINGGGSTPPTAPVGAFDAAPTSGFAPLTVTFTDRSTNSPTAWAWNFGDPSSGSSNTSTQQNPTHTYADPGTYTVTLTPSNAAGAGSQATRTINVSTPPTGGGNVLVGAGDIADCNRTTDEATARLLDGIAGTVFAAGDAANPNGTAAEYANCYGPTWGRHKSRTRPAIGDNDYGTAGAAGYFGYFGSTAGDPNTGYYSFDLGSWHIVVLNGNCAILGGGSASAGCGTNSPQTTWLRGDLAASSASCTLAILHQPRFTSRRTTPDGPYAALWTALYNAGAEIVISGHQHNYERFAPQTPAGASDPSFGVRQFVVGTGGVSLNTFPSTTMTNSQVKNDNTHGVLKLTLHSLSYDFEFVPVAGRTFTDSGVGTCHGAPSSATQAAAFEATALETQRSNLLNDRRRRPH